jgi:hypothetical protein
MTKQGLLGSACPTAMASAGMGDLETAMASAGMKSLEGVMPETWCCIDCGVNTAPGFATRIEAETAFLKERKKKLAQYVDDRSELHRA